MLYLRNGFHRSIFFVALVLLIVSCSGHKKLNDDVTYKYSCANGEGFTNTVHQDSDQVIIRTPDNMYILDITPSGSGEKYTDGMNTFYTEGPEATLELSDGKVYKECKIIK